MQFGNLFENKVFIAALLGWAIAQILKVIVVAFSAKKIDYSRFVGSGGMPSSHSALVMALSTKTGLVEGFNSTAFAIAATFAVVVMYDAAGVRRAAGTQAKLLNAIIEDLSHNRGIEHEKLKELIGHTPVEVIAGAILGVLIGIIA